VLKPIELGVQEYQIAAGKTASPKQKHQKEAKKLIQFLSEEWPVLRNDPAFQDWLHNKKPGR